MIDKEKLHFKAPKPLSSVNQAHLKNKSSSGQSLSLLCAASSPNVDRTPRDRNGSEKMMSQTPVISTHAPVTSQDVRPSGVIDRDFYRTSLPALRNRPIQDAAARTIQKISEHLRAPAKDLKWVADYRVRHIERHFRAKV